MPSEVLKRYPHLDLTDEDFAWLGAIVAYWAAAENKLEGLIHDLAGIDPVIGAPHTEKRIISFEKKIETAKKLLTSACAGFPLCQEIGRALMIRGKELSKDRKVIAHWNPQRGSPLATDMRFVDIYGYSVPQESPHLENGLISGLFGPHFERTGCPKAGTSIQCDPSLDNCGTRTSTSGLVMREPTDQSANPQLHFRSRKNEGMAEVRWTSRHGKSS